MRGIYPTQILKGNTVHWIKIPPLEARDTASPKVLNNASRILKH